MNKLVLELSPGAGLFGRAFEYLGFTVVRGSDILWGGYVREFSAKPNMFDGVIDGAPCQMFSVASGGSSKAENLIPEFLRVVDEAKPKWAVMENVTQVKEYGPNWPSEIIRDYDAGGLTHRTRRFWYYGCDAHEKPPTREGDAELSVLASQWKNRGKDGRKSYRQQVTAEEAARLQGFEGLHTKIMNGQPSGITDKQRQILAIHMIGNGVPLHMGLYVAKHILKEVYKEEHVENRSNNIQNIR